MALDFKIPSGYLGSCSGLNPDYNSAGRFVGGKMENPEEGLGPRPRLSIPFTPKWEGPIEGWTVNYCRDQVWRVVPRFEMEDLYQEGFLLFLACVARYPDVVDPPHFMALYKRSLINRIHDLAEARTASRASPDDHDFDEFEDRGPTGLDELELKLAIDEAPRAVQQLIASLTELPRELVAFARGTASEIRETTEQRLQRLAGVQVPVRAMIDDWLQVDSLAWERQLV